VLAPTLAKAQRISMAWRCQVTLRVRSIHSQSFSLADFTWNAG
jgi:hypothetical protein